MAHVKPSQPSSASRSAVIVSDSGRLGQLIDQPSGAEFASAIALQYAEQVIAGEIVACKQVIQACQRHLRDLERSADPSFPYFFDSASAARICKFVEGLPHTKGKWAAKHETIRLEPVQVFILASLFGWLEKSDPSRYRFREAYICLARKNAKSTIAAGIALYKFAADGEHGAEVYFGATSEDHARRLGFTTARRMALGTPGLQKAFGVTVNAKSLLIESNGSVMKPLIGSPGDGDSPSCAVIDEYHEYRSDVQVDAMKTGMGARENPLLLIITTAGTDRSSPCYARHLEIEKLLAGTITDERTFGIIFCADPEDVWTSELALAKANPLLGVSVDAAKLRDDQLAATRSPRKQNVFKTKHLDIWCNAAVAWIPDAKWDACCDATLALEQFSGEECCIALDLASTTNLAAKVRVFRRELEDGAHYYAFANHYLCQAALDEATGEHYAGWAHEGWLTVTPGNRTDYGAIADDLVRDSANFAIREVPHDPWHAAALVQEIQRRSDWPQNTEFVEFRQTLGNFSPAMKELEAVILDGRFHHNGDPVLAWCVSNVVAKINGRGDVFPEKQSQEANNDGGIALIMAFARAHVIEPADLVGISLI